MLYKWIPTGASDTGNGSLTMFQEGERGNLPFPIKKVLVVSGMKPGDVRGNHAHRETREIVFAIRGGCDFTLDDGTRTETVTLAADGRALFLPALVWRTFTRFREDTILLIVADREYDEKEYLRDAAEFRALVGSKAGL